jgi:hypothetical protein
MAATNNMTSIPPREWTQLTTADATAVAVQNFNSPNGGAAVYLIATAGAVVPTATPSALGCKRLEGGQIIAADLTLAQLWPGISGTRLYAYCDQPAQVSVSHA